MCITHSAHMFILISFTLTHHMIGIINAIPHLSSLVRVREKASSFWPWERWKRRKSGRTAPCVYQLDLDKREGCALCVSTFPTNDDLQRQDNICSGMQSKMVPLTNHVQQSPWKLLGLFVMVMLFSYSTSKSQSWYVNCVIHESLWGKKRGKDQV